MSTTKIPPALLDLYPQGSLEKRAITILYQRNEKKFKAFVESGGAKAILKVFQQIKEHNLETDSLTHRVNYATSCTNNTPATYALNSHFLQTRIQTFIRSGGHRTDLMEALKINDSLQARIHILNEETRYFSHPNTTLPSKIFYLLKGFPFWSKRTTQLETETAEIAKQSPTWYINALVIAGLGGLTRLEKKGAPFTFELSHLEQINRLSDKKRKKVLEALIQEKKVSVEELEDYAEKHHYTNVLQSLGKGIRSTQTTSSKSKSP